MRSRNVTDEPERCRRLHRRLRQHRSRLAARRWAYRQRHCAKGAWPKLCRTLAAAEQAYAISEAELTELLAEGHRLEPAGADLEPPKRLVFVSQERAARLTTGRSISLCLSADLLAAQHLALVPFSGGRA